jgi:hypothetical protein
MNRRRRLLILLLGFGLLLVITLLGSSLEGFLHQTASTPTASEQTQQAGPYQATLQISPNPPTLTQSTDLTLQIVRHSTRQPVLDAHVEATAIMEEMIGMDEKLSVTPQSNGSYLTHLTFSMSGTWTLRVLIAAPTGQEAATVDFKVNVP